MYATLVDMIVRFGERQLIELTDRSDPPSGVVDGAVVQAAIDDAAAHVTAALATAGYATPLASVPSMIVAVTCDIARYKLFADLPMASEKSEKHIVEKRHENALRIVADIATGLLRLPGVETTDSAGAGVGIGTKRGRYDARFDCMYGVSSWR